MPRPAMFVAIVTAPYRPAWATISASISWYLAFSTECLMPFFLSMADRRLGLVDRDGADEHGLALLVQLFDLVDGRIELAFLGLVDEIGIVDADHGPVRRDDDDVEVVDLREFRRLGLGRTGHARELVVEPEIVLERDRGKGLVLVLDLDVFLGLDGLVQTVAPAPARHEPARELVDDHDLVVFDHIVHIAVEQGMGLQGLVDVMDQIDVRRVVEVAGAQAVFSTLTLPSSVRATVLVFSSMV